MVPWGLWNPLPEQPGVPRGVPAAFQQRSGVAGTVPALPAGTPQERRAVPAGVPAPFRPRSSGHPVDIADRDA